MNAFALQMVGPSRGSDDRGGPGLQVNRGCLSFTKSFRKIRLESKGNATVWVVPVEIFREQRNF